MTTKAKCKLDGKEQGIVVHMAQMLLSYARNSSEVIGNIKTGYDQTPREYVNDALRSLGIDAEFKKPLPVRDVATLEVVGVFGPLPGRVSRGLEYATRRNPDTPVKAFRSRGRWLHCDDPAADETLVTVRVRATKKAKVPRD